MSWDSKITEWWDYAGTHHKGEPSADQLLDDARQFTGHVWDERGNDIYFTSLSDDGWTEEEMQDDMDDAGDHYGDQ